MPTLLFYYPEKDKRWRVEIPDTSFIIGRSREAGVSIPIPSVSKQHVAVERKGRRFVYRDLGSRNGVYLNGFRMDRGALEDGDEIQVGGVKITFYEGKPPEAPISDPGLAAAPTPRSRGDSADETEPSGQIEASSQPEKADPKSLDAGLSDSRDGEAILGPEILAGDEIDFERPEAPQDRSAVPAPCAASSVETAEPASKSPSQEDSISPGSPSPASEAAELAASPPSSPSPDSPQSPALSSEAEPGPSRSAAPRPSMASHREKPRFAMGPRALVHGSPPWRHSPQPRRSPSVQFLVFVVLLCAGTGFVLGFLGSRLDRAPPAPAAEPAPVTPPATAGPDAAPQEEKKSVENPLGALPRKQDAEATARLIVRLHLDLLGRPPTRRELSDLMPLSFENLWARLDKQAQPRFDSTQKIDEVFPLFLGRKAEPLEKERLLALSGNDPAYFAFHVAFSIGYATASHRRPRSPTQIARSLYTNLLDRIPSDAALKPLIDALAANPEALAEASRRLLDSPDASAPPPDALAAEPKAAERWIQETYFLFLLRGPSKEEEAKALALLRASKDGWRELYLDLVSRAEHAQY